MQEALGGAMRAAAGDAGGEDAEAAAAGRRAAPAAAAFAALLPALQTLAARRGPLAPRARDLLCALPAAAPANW